MMPPRSVKTLVLALGDILVFLTALLIALVVRYGGPPDAALLGLYRFAAPFLVLLWFAGFFIFQLYDLKTAKNTTRFFERLSRAIVFNFVATVMLLYTISEFRLRPLVFLIILFAVMTLMLALWRAAAHATFARLAKERVLFLGIAEETASLSAFLDDNPQLGFVAVACIQSASTENKISLPSKFG